MQVAGGSLCITFVSFVLGRALVAERLSGSSCEP